MGGRVLWAGAHRLLWCGVIVLSGCGPRVAPEIVVAPTADDVSVTVPYEELPPGRTAQPDPAEPGRPPASEPSPPAASPPPGGQYPGENHNTVFKISMSHACVHPGQSITAHLTGPPRAKVSMVVSYGRTDESLHPGPMHIDSTDDQGRFDWTFLVDPAVPHGAAEVLGGSSGPHAAQEGGGTASATFAVAAAC